LFVVTPPAFLLLDSLHPFDCFTTHRLGSIQFSSHLNLFIPLKGSSLLFSFPRWWDLYSKKVDDGIFFYSSGVFFPFFLSIWMDGWCCRAKNSIMSVTPSYIIRWIHLIAAA
jgi:hypothetical protein